MDRLAKEALKESIMKLNYEQVDSKNSANFVNSRLCNELWEKELEEKILIIEKVILDSIPVSARAYIIELCILDLLKLLNSIESAGILSALNYLIFSPQSGPKMIISANLEDLINMGIPESMPKDKDKSGVVV